MSWRVYQELRHTDIARLGELVDQLTAGQPDSTADAKGAAADAAQDAQPDTASPTAAAAAAAEEPGQEADSGQAPFDSVRTRSKGSSRSASTRASRQSGGSRDDGGWAYPPWTLLRSPVSFAYQLLPHPS
jgi:hypothetical protein